MEDHEADTGQQTELDPGDDDQGQGDAGRQTGLPAVARGPDGLEMEAAVPGAAAAAELFLAVTAPTGAAVRPLVPAVVTAVVDDLGFDDAFVIAGLTAVAPGRGVSVLGIGIEGDMILLCQVGRL